MTAHHVYINDAGEYGEFFYRESSGPDGDRVRYSATWTCYSSYGVYGHHWSSMGGPFARFIKDIEPSYLLGKISRMVQDDEKLVRSVIAKLDESLEARLNPDFAKKARRRAKCILRRSDGGTALSNALMNDRLLAAAMIDWCSLDGDVWDQQAEAFVKRLWPKFVDAVAAREAVPA